MEEKAGRSSGVDDLLKCRKSWCCFWNFEPSACLAPSAEEVRSWLDGSAFINPLVNCGRGAFNTKAIPRFRHHSGWCTKARGWFSRSNRTIFPDANEEDGNRPLKVRFGVITGPVLNGGQLWTKAAQPICLLVANKHWESANRLGLGEWQQGICFIQARSHHQVLHRVALLLMKWVMAWKNGRFNFAS